MNLLDVLKDDQTPAGLAALKDYLYENDVPDAIDEEKVIETVRTLLDRACKLAVGSEVRLKLGPIVEARLACIGKRARVTFYANGKRILSVGQQWNVWGGDSLYKARWAVKSLQCLTVKRILSGIDV